MIIETALLTDDEKVTACTLAKAAGADFVKTSTGFGPGGATADDVALMRARRGRRHGRKGGGRRERLRGPEGDGGCRRHARRRQRWRAHRAGVARRPTGCRHAVWLLRRAPTRNAHFTLENPGDILETRTVEK